MNSLEHFLKLYYCTCLESVRKPNFSSRNRLIWVYTMAVLGRAKQRQIFFWQTSPPPSIICQFQHLKGQCHEILRLWVFFKQFLLVPLETPRNYFKYFRIFEELFIFVIDSPVYSPPGSRDSQVYSPPGKHDFPVYSSPETPWCIHQWGVGLNWFTKEPCQCKIHWVEKTPCD